MEADLVAIVFALDGKTVFEILDLPTIAGNELFLVLVEEQLQLTLFFPQELHLLINTARSAHKHQKQRDDQQKRKEKKR